MKLVQELMKKEKLVALLSLVGLLLLIVALPVKEKRKTRRRWDCP